ncbi:MAG TPA: hypothetical protein PK867_18700 [Pirellulales bacterium]|nr:hypothetical protein [Pirellulales bacterium]
MFVVVSASVFVIGQRGRCANSTDPAGQTSTRGAIEVVRLKPPGDPSVEIDCQSLTFVDFTYRIFNRGKVPITRLQIGTQCACEQVGSPPGEILPGNSAPSSFRLRGPDVGRLQRKIPLIVEGASEPVAVLDVSLRVKFEPPQLVPPPDGLSLSFIAGDRSPRDLMFEAIEAKRKQPWICGVEFNLHDELDVQPLEIEELPESDRDLTRRRYRLPIVNRSLPIGMQMTTAALQTRAGSVPVRDSLAIWVNVLDSVAILPNPLVIKYSAGSSPQPRRVRIVNRSGDKVPVTPVRFDRDRLRIDLAGEQTGSTATFDVVPVETAEFALETQVAFDIGNNETRELVVRLEPSERP